MGAGTLWSRGKVSWYDRNFLYLLRRNFLNVLFEFRRAVVPWLPLVRCGCKLRSRNKRPESSTSRVIATTSTVVLVLTTLPSDKNTENGYGEPPLFWGLNPCITQCDFGSNQLRINFHLSVWPQLTGWPTSQSTHQPWSYVVSDRMGTSHCSSAGCQ